MKVLTNRNFIKKMSIILLIFTLYKIGTYIAVPGANRAMMAQLVSDNKALGMANMFSGGAISNFSIFSVGIMPYITASIIVQLLSAGIHPTLTEWRKQGGNSKKTKYVTYALTLLFAVVQSVGLSVGFNKMLPGVVTGGFFTYALIAVCLVLGTITLLLFAELIEKKAMGKGVSMIILAGILMTIPIELQQFLVVLGEGTSVLANFKDFIFVLQLLVIFLLVSALTLLVIQIQKSERRLPIIHGGMGHQGKMFVQNNRDFLPLKLNPSGVIPVIFASSIFLTPVTVATMFPDLKVSTWILANVTYEKPIGMIVFGLLIFGFTYVSLLLSSPKEISDSLRKSNTYILGIRSGEETTKLLYEIVIRLLFIGGLFLTFVAEFPLIMSLLMNVPNSAVLGGTSIIIVVSVLIELQESAKVQTLDYSKITKKGFIK